MLNAQYEHFFNIIHYIYIHIKKWPVFNHLTLSEKKNVTNEDLKNNFNGRWQNINFTEIKIISEYWKYLYQWEIAKFLFIRLLFERESNLFGRNL